MENDKLIGTDGALYLETVSVTVEGDGTSTLDELAGGTIADGGGAGFYQVTAIGDSTTYSWTPEVGDYFYDDGTLALAVGDDAIFILPETEIGIGEDSSIKSFSVSLSKEKEDVTTLINKKQKVYRIGSQADASGTLDGITTLSNNKIRSKFIDTLVVDGATKTMTRKSDDSVFLIGFLNETDTTGESKLAIIGKVILEGLTLGVAGSGTQDFSTNFSPASGNALQLIEIVVG